MKVDIRTMERLLRGKCLPAEYLVRQFDALHERAEAAERERDELRESLAVMDGRLSASRALKQLWKNRAGNAEEEIARRDAAAASKPVAWISERNLKILGKAFSVSVKHEPVMVRPVALYTAAPPAVVSDEMLRELLRTWDRAEFKSPDVYQRMREVLGAQPQKPVVLPAGREFEMFHTTACDETIYVMYMRSDEVLAALDAANVPHKVKE